MSFEQKCQALAMKLGLVIGVVAISTPGAARAEVPYTLTHDALAAIQAILPTCSGGVTQTGTGSRVREAQDIGASLPQAGELAVALTEARAVDTYRIAAALLKPALPNPERAIDPRTSVHCPSNPALGVRLMMFLAGSSPASVVGPSNSLYWLGIASRRGVGVEKDAAKARAYFLKFVMLTPEAADAMAPDWREKPEDMLLTTLGRPPFRAMLEKASAAGKSGAQFLLGQQLLKTNPLMARDLLEKSAGQYLPAALLLARLESSGAFGIPAPEKAVAVLARYAAPGGSAYGELIAAAVRYNAIGPDIPIAQMAIKLDQLGGIAALSDTADVELVTGGSVAARAFVAPDGRILFVELVDPAKGMTRIGQATLRIFRAVRLKLVEPMQLGNRAVFHWAVLPTINWK